MGYFPKISQIDYDLCLYVGMGTRLGCSQEGAATWLAQDEGEGSQAVDVGRGFILKFRGRYTAFVFCRLRLSSVLVACLVHDIVVYVSTAANLSMYASLTYIFGSALFSAYL